MLHKKWVFFLLKMNGYLIIRLDIDWLKPKYRDLDYVRSANDLSDFERKVIEGVHTRDYHNGILPLLPSKLDHETLNQAYLTLKSASDTGTYNKNCIDSKSPKHICEASH